ncbi:MULTISPECIES: preprotein translocase subunit SecY [unclassified Actinomyces]|uniref:preprotein translocase subunit SecY n=1 Tax=unclassified Actinomyces TaxID=2609248 RepID=UPI001374125A|nr:MULTISPECIES: preprotein translocase subunit SecY [unclassified Actinomyces]MBW3069044.1 preprotein translocase subunit SecY [Actinomyces sp. 594]NDR54196.1 preprotein translocase subunit SecY [Actinomyces sp. 565]QHO91625.1 preprotein translocase subunit SecY [Actinomyces sp. 432]
MFSAFIQAFKTPDLRRKLLFTLGIMALFRFGSVLPTPGVDLANVQICVGESQDEGLLGLINIFSGGALLQLSVFALGIMPYITASIIIQLLRVVIPRFEELYKEGQSGTAKLTEYTRYLTIGLGVLQSATIVATAANGNLFTGCSVPVIPDDSPANLALMIVTMTAGTGLIMWLGELITERGIGNGMSLLIFTSIVARMPQNLFSILAGSGGPSRFLAVVAVILVATLAVVFVEQATRRIPVQYAKRMVGRRQYGGSTTYIPIKINTAGVIPVIFASSLLAMPQLVAQFGSPTSSWVQWIATNLRQTDTIYLVGYGLLVFAFTFFYTAITFNAEEIADNMKRYGGFIPGIRAGEPTVRYLSYVINRVTAAGAVYLLILALVPTLAVMWLGLSQNLPFGGTTILIMVGVGLQTVKEINSQLQQRHYEGFLS